MPPVRLGYVGYGNSAIRYHLPFIANNPDIELYAFYQRSPPPSDPTALEAKRHCTIDHPGAKHYTDLDAFLADEAIEVVVVVTDHTTHADFAEKALLAGKHVVVEKPVANSTEAWERAMKVSEQTGKLLIPYQNRRYDSDMRTLQKIVSAGYLGDIHEAEFHHDLAAPSWLQHFSKVKYEPGDGFLWMVASHTLDQVLHLFGLPRSITAFTRVLRGVESEIEDTHTIILQFESPLLVTVKTNCMSVMHKQLKYFVRGSNGSFVKYGEDQQCPDGPQLGRDEAGCELDNSWGQIETQTKVLDDQEYTGSTWSAKVKTEKGDWGEYYADVVRAVRGEIEPVIKAETSRDGLRIIEIARQSAAEGRTLPFVR